MGKWASANDSPGLAWGGTPSQIWGVSPLDLRWVPLDLGWGTPWTWEGVPPQTWDGVPPRHETGYPPGHGTGYPPWTWDRVPPQDMGQGTPPDLRWGTPPRQISLVSTCYTAGGMPLAFTQEDFLVENYFKIRASKKTIHSNMSSIREQFNWVSHICLQETFYSFQISVGILSVSGNKFKQ